MTKITPDHFAREAFVYVRQSTADQVLNNHESRRRQYALADRARALGWSTIEVIDDDLGRSGSGVVRPGFEKLLAAVHHMLTNPIYAGAYAFGRTVSRVTIEQGRERVVRGFRKERSDWEILILDRHEGYIDWIEFERNQRRIADNANGKSFMSRGSIRRGEALLAGLLRCGHCSRKLHVAYSGENGNTGRYHCRGGQLNHGGDPCISFGGMRVDRAVGAEVIERVQPLPSQLWRRANARVPRS